ncbi:MAG: siderophore-interacting protein [Microlunatus sp.]
MPRQRREQLTFPINIRRLEVRRILDLGPGMRRLTLAGDQLGGFVTDDGIAVPPLRNEGFDDHVKLIVPGPGQAAPVPPIQVEGHLNWDPPGGRPNAKDYTPRRYDPSAGEIDLDFVRHGTGCASTWAEQVAVGDPAWIAGPKSSALLPRDVDWLLVGGDETALPAIGRLLEELPAGLPARVFVEVADAAHEIELPTREGVEVHWLHRGATPAGRSDVLEQAIRAMDWPAGEVYAWLAGEAVTLKPLRTFLKIERQVPRDCLEVTGYWRRRETVGIPATEEEAVDEVSDHDRLHDLADLTGAYALRAAVTCGLIEALDGRTATLAELAERTRSRPAVLSALARLLVRLEVLSHADGRFGLGPLGAELVEDEEELAEYDLTGPRSALELSVAGLLDTLRDGRAAPDRAGLTIAERADRDSRFAAAARAETEEEGRWPAPSIASHLDWSNYGTVVGLGPASGQAMASILREHPGVRGVLADLPSGLAVVRDTIVETAFADRLELVEQSPFGPVPAGDVLLAVELLERLPDADATVVLRQLLTGPTPEVIVVERVTDDEEDDLAESELLSHCAYGVGLRSLTDLIALATSAGAETVETIEIGWDRRLLRLT